MRRLRVPAITVHYVDEATRLRKRRSEPKSRMQMSSVSSNALLQTSASEIRMNVQFYVEYLTLSCSRSQQHWQ